MDTHSSSITVAIARTPTEINLAMAFCGAQYERNYGTHWSVPPDLFFVARENGKIIATGGLTIAARHPQIASERYYHLTGEMTKFVQKHRDSIVEFGRFSSIKRLAAKAILHNVISFCRDEGLEFMLAWANPSVYKHTADTLGVNFWPITAQLNVDAALNDLRWASPPTGYFVRDNPPGLHMGIIPFWENVNASLAKDCGKINFPGLPDSTHVKDVLVHDAN